MAKGRVVRRGKAQKMTREHREARAERNARRNRKLETVQWAKKHIVKTPGAAGYKPRPSRRQQAAEAVTKALKRMPAVEDARLEKGSTIPRATIRKQQGDR